MWQGSGEEGERAGIEEQEQRAATADRQETHTGRCVLRVQSQHALDRGTTGRGFKIDTLRTVWI